MVRSADRIISDLKRFIITELRKSLGYVVDQNYGIETPLAIAHGLEFRSIEVLIEDALNQITPITADIREEVIDGEPTNPLGMLEIYGVLKDIEPRRHATPGTYRASVDVIPETDGEIIPIGAELTSISGNTGINLVVTKGINLIQSTIGNPIGGVIELEAVETGANTALRNGTVLSFNTPIPNINKEATIIIGDNDGVTNLPQDAESIESFRERIINAFRYEVSGGKTSDFRAWANDLPGIVNVFPYSAIPSSEFADSIHAANIGIGFMRIYLEFKDGGNHQQEIANYIRLIQDKIPATAGQIIVQACRIKSVNILIRREWIEGALTDDDIDYAMQECRTVALNYLRNRRPFIPAIDAVDRSEVWWRDLWNLMNVAGNRDFHIRNFMWGGNKSTVENNIYGESFTLGIGEIPRLDWIGTIPNGRNYLEEKE